MAEEKVILTLKQGLEDEMVSAFNYIAAAAKYGDTDLKRELIGYAVDELLHAQKILDMFDMLAENPGKIKMKLLDSEDLYSYLIEYISGEESAVFYYHILEELQDAVAVKNVCRDMRREEEKHLARITLILNKLKSGELDGENESV